MPDLYSPLQKSWQAVIIIVDNMKTKSDVKKLRLGPEFSFFLRANLKKYTGQYIAIVNENVVAAGSNAEIVWRKARKKHPHCLPTLAKLPKAGALVLVF